MRFSEKKIWAIAFASIILGAFGLGYGIYSAMTINTADDDGDEDDDEIIKYVEIFQELPYNIIIPTFDENDVFVSTKGLDSPDRGNKTDPYQTIEYALSQAASQGAERIIVEIGLYNESITLEDGISILGGYSEDFLFYSLKYYRPIVQAKDSSHWTIYGSGITSVTIVEGFIIKGPYITSSGINSYGIYLEDCNSSLTIRDCEIWGGTAGDGTPGILGPDGMDGTNGQNGQAATEQPKATYSSVPGGQGGQRIADDATPLHGGYGGETAHIPPLYDTQTAFDGNPGQPLSGGGQGGEAGYDSAFLDPGTGLIVILPPNNIDGFDGQNGGDGTDGLGGIGGEQNIYSIVAGEWQGDDGENGLHGTHGSGGGGGGAGGGIDDDTYGGYGKYVFGGTGGGGGSGGERGRRGGGGQAGGGAFCIYIVNTSLTSSFPSIYNNSLYLGRGGDGGNGGAGGVGGSAGNGGSGGNVGAAFPLNVAGKGGDGGDGGDGGHGGGGGGGAGGWSIGIFTYNGNSPTYDISNKIELSTGGAGLGGLGGGSLGNSGTTAGDGLLSKIYYGS